jgi:SAM-dependent methyltransferase
MAESSAAAYAIEEDDWGLPFDFNLFARHQRHQIAINESEIVEIECVEGLTPLDMMDLGAGVHDATGHCVWTGAFFLIDCLGRLQGYFHQKRVIELGSGTGIAGIALLRLPQSAPSFLCFTDADTNALELCRRNCQLNFRKEQSYAYSTEELSWGRPLPPSVLAASFDTCLGTDIFYDFAILPTILQTASTCLRETGCFLLSHVPRACFKTDHPLAENLEEYIIQQAAGSGLHLESILRPRDLILQSDSLRATSSNTLQVSSLSEMDEIGVAVLIFRKYDACESL